MFSDFPRLTFLCLENFEFVRLLSVALFVSSIIDYRVRIVWSMRIIFEAEQTRVKKYID